MKTYVIPVLLIMAVLSACSRHSTPPAASTKNNVSTNTNTGTANNSSTTNANTSTAPAPSMYTKAIVIVDGKGRMLVSDSSLPSDASRSILDNSSARAFTPAQTKNLAYRFNHIPPKILYVPNQLTKTSAKGTYYIYQKKFWFWKKTDGYFYLDENYYN